MKADDVTPGQTIRLTLTVRDTLPAIFGTKVQLAGDRVLVLLDPTYEVETQP